MIPFAEDATPILIYILILLLTATNVCSYNLLCDPTITWHRSSSLNGSDLYSFNQTSCTVKVSATTDHFYDSRMINVTSIFTNPTNYPLNFTINGNPIGGDAEFDIEFKIDGLEYEFFMPRTSDPLQITYEWLSPISTDFNRYFNGNLNLTKVPSMEGFTASDIVQIGLVVHTDYIWGPDNFVIFDYASLNAINSTVNTFRYDDIEISESTKSSDPEAESTKHRETNDTLFVDWLYVVLIVVIVTCVLIVCIMMAWMKYKQTALMKTAIMSAIHDKKSADSNKVLDIEKKTDIELVMVQSNSFIPGDPKANSNVNIVDVALPSSPPTVGSTVSKALPASISATRGSHEGRNSENVQQIEKSVESNSVIAHNSNIDSNVSIAEVALPASISVISPTSGNTEKITDSEGTGSDHVHNGKSVQQYTMGEDV